MTGRRGAEPPSPGNPKASGVVRWIERSMEPGARVVRVEPLPESATSKQRIDVALADGSMRRLVLRCYDDRERLGRDPWYVPAHEARVLRLLSGTPVPAPRLHAVDLEAVCGAPALLESWMPGEPAWRPDDLDRYLVRAAEVLVAIHAVAVPLDAELPRYAPYYRPERIGSPPFSTRPGLWEEVSRTLGTAWPAHRETFIHRDYHPGNVLWDGTRVTGVVDWATAALGPPGIDLARMRSNLAAHHGKDAADRFVAAYVSAGGDPSARHPFWDLLDAADLLPDLGPATALGGGEVDLLEDWMERVLAELVRSRTSDRRRRERR